MEREEWDREDWKIWQQQKKWKSGVRKNPTYQERQGFLCVGFKWEKRNARGFDPVVA